MQDLLDKLTTALAIMAQEYDLSGEWPAESLRAYGELGGWSWGVPKKYGGAEMPAAQRIRVYGALARGCMNTALYVTQHESGLDLICMSNNEGLKERVLPRYARGEGLTTIGYAQLTTSHQGGEPVFRGRLEGDDIVLEGFMPWVTGAGKIESVAAGAVMPNGEQVVVLLPFDTPGVEVKPPMKLLALDAAHTSAVHCHGVRLPQSEIVAGPVVQVLARRSPIRRLSVSATGLGLIAGIADCIRVLEGSAPKGSAPKGAAPKGSALESAARKSAVPEITALKITAPPGLPRYADEVERHRAALAERLDALAAEENAEKEDIDTLRSDINALLTRLAGVLMTIAKGSGYLRDREAQRLAREALFFCVWSAQDPVRQATITKLLGEEV